MKYAEKMKKELVNELSSTGADRLYYIYDQINAWDGAFCEMGIERFSVEELIDLGLLESFVTDLSMKRMDHNPLYSEYFTPTIYGWEEWDESTLYDNVGELADYLIENAGYSGFPRFALEDALLELFGSFYDGDEIERYCSIIRDHI